jgi:ribosomal protein S18 acetylase RimI-like enzyme
VALYKAGGWWEEGLSNRKLIPKVVRHSFAFAIAKNTRGKIVGMGRVISDGFSDAYIQDVIVLPAYRNKGVGMGIIRTLAEFCRGKKIPWVGLVAEPGTYRFYRKAGFRDKKGFQLMLLDQEKKS